MAFTNKSVKHESLSHSLEAETVQKLSNSFIGNLLINVRHHLYPQTVSRTRKPQKWFQGVVSGGLLSPKVQCAQKLRVIILAFLVYPYFTSVHSRSIKDTKVSCNVRDGQVMEEETFNLTRLTLKGQHRLSKMDTRYSGTYVIYH